MLIQGNRKQGETINATRKGRRISRPEPSSRIESCVEIQETPVAIAAATRVSAEVFAIVRRDMGE
ncbi:hypothetical protein VSX64_25765, partial [Aurantimonas sp. C2-6-R+9]|uniref:hypothetical protein n=1 Tax=Aurantimonas sp. C2-6-R+9 TaxID=3114365 RepID=UPI002E1880B4|nr:hypothetical protein [Aurantimonas sp. C2-6-R+9]